MNQLSLSEKKPVLPAVFAAPFRLIPSRFHSKGLAVILNRILIQQIREGDLDFLQGRSLQIRVTDAGISYYLSMRKEKLIELPEIKAADLRVESSVYDFLNLAARQEDPDTLMFQRRLVMQGDTELGLELKNFLDGLDIESSGFFSAIESILHKGLPIYRRVFG